MVATVVFLSFLYAWGRGGAGESSSDAMVLANGNEIKFSLQIEFYPGFGVRYHFDPLRF